MLQDFIKFLPIAEKIIPGRTGIDVIKNIAVCKGYMMATDLEMTVLMKIDDKREFLIPLSIIKTVLKSRPIRFDIDLSEQNRIKITYDDKAVSFPANDVNEYPMFPKQKFHYMSGPGTRPASSSYTVSCLIAVWMNYDRHCAGSMSVRTARSHPVLQMGMY